MRYLREILYYNKFYTFSGRDRSVVVPETQLGDVALTLPKHGYRQLAHDDLLHMLLPQVGSILP